MLGMRAKGNIQRKNYQYGQRGPPFAAKTSSVSSIAYLHARNIAEWKVAFNPMTHGILRFCELQGVLFGPGPENKVTV